MSWEVTGDSGCSFANSNQGWSRRRLQMGLQGKAENIAGADFFVFGHTPIKAPFRLENQVYLDTGAVYGNRLSLFSIKDLEKLEPHKKAPKNLFL